LMLLLLTNYVIPLLAMLKCANSFMVAGKTRTQTEQLSTLALPILGVPFNFDILEEELYIPF